MPIHLRSFIGEIPKLHPRLLPDNAAQVSRETALDRGVLSPIRETLTVETLPSTSHSFVFHKGDWLGFSQVNVRAVAGPVDTSRLYITGNGTPKIYRDSTYMTLAITAPPTALDVAASAPSGDDTALSEDVFFTYTFLTDLDEETPPAPPSDLVALDETQTVDLTGFTVPPAGRGFNRLRIYRSVTTAAGQTSLHFIKQLSHTPDAPQTDFRYNPTVHTPNEELTSGDYDPPPAGLAGIVSMPNGIMAAFAGKRLYFCEPYVPHAWPTKYMLTVNHPIVGLAAFGTTLAVLTEGTPYRVQGTHPDNMVMEQVEENLPCVSAAGIVDMGYQAIYPSTEGLVAISATGATLVTQNVFTLDQWRALEPQTIRAGNSNGRYVMSHREVGQPRKLVLFDARGQVPSIVRSDKEIIAFHRRVDSSELYCLTDTLTVEQWEGPGRPDRAYRWRGKIVEVPYPANFGAIFIQGAFANPTAPSNAFSANVYADGVLLHTIHALGAPERLPSSRRARVWEIEIEGTAEVSGVDIAKTLQELRP